MQSVLGEQGRTYHGYKEGKYLLPNDAAEQDRLDFQHAAFRILLLDKLFLAPITNPMHVLDVATGTGIWAVQFAEMFPGAQVIGSDLSKIQPANAPANCTFIKADAEEAWSFAQKFDFVHLRFVFTCFSHPKRMMQQAFDAMKPGGWLEYQDPSIAEPSSAVGGNVNGSAFQRLLWMMRAGVAAATGGREIEVAPRYRRWMQEVGFVDVQEVRIPCPAGPWAEGDERLKLAGTYMRQNYYDMAEATWKMTRSAGLSEAEATQFIADFRAELMDERRNKFYTMVYIVFGRKP
ncbi:S-adenosyl-L-methionine-dependent methyltransferase [Xylariales sp. PMI_506]|nr:S-adenosyl-L-methionine-dependent methyltransferase [Xylariales sp. PMI_506]